MKNPIIKTLMYLLLIFAAGCSASNSGTDDHDHDHAVTDDGHSHAVADSGPETAGEVHEEGEVTLSPMQMEKIGLRTERITNRNLSNVLKANGFLELPPQNQAHVSSMTSGNVSQIFVRPGAYVKRGQSLVRLQHPDLIQLQQDFVEALSRLEFLEKEYARQEALSKEQITAEKKFQETTAEYKSLKSRVKGLRTRLNLIGLNAAKVEEGEIFSSVAVRAPISGFIGEIHINIGTHVNPEKVMFEIVDNHHIHIDLLVYEKDLHSIQLGQQVRFWLQNHPGQTYEAKVFAIGKAVEEEQKAVRVHAEIIKDEEHLLPGMYVEARVNTGDAKVPSLPEDAVVTDKALNFIFVKEEELASETHFRKIQVLRGVSDGGFVEVNPLESIDPDAEVVTEGAFFLLAQTKIDEGGISHEH